MNETSAGNSGQGGKGHHAPSLAQKKYLKSGLDQPGGKLPLFDRNGQRISARTIRACMEAGWCEPWHKNPIAPDWLVCRLTDRGRQVAGQAVRKNR